MNVFNKKTFSVISVILILALLLSGCSNQNNNNNNTTSEITANNESTVFNIDNVPQFSDQPYIVINNNQPNFNKKDLVTECYEFYSELDFLGRCGVTMACVGIEIMPTEKRGSIGQVKPTGWHTVKYDNVDGKYLYNRCHLIGYQLTGENANVKNLITGTVYLNIEGMLPFENMIADYVKETKNHVVYRVTPVFDGNNLLARGVQLEAMSVEDKGEGICFNVYAYNSQPDILIDYATGESRLKNDTSLNDDSTKTENETYILNTNSKKYHTKDCNLAETIKPKNKKTYIQLVKLF